MKSFFTVLSVLVLHSEGLKYCSSKTKSEVTEHDDNLRRHLNSNSNLNTSRIYSYKSNDRSKWSSFPQSTDYYDIANYVQDAHLQHCVVIEMGDGFCAWFVDILPRSSLQKHHLDMYELKDRRKDCTLTQARNQEHTGHIRLCDVTGTFTWNCLAHERKQTKQHAEIAKRTLHKIPLEFYKLLDNEKNTSEFYNPKTTLLENEFKKRSKAIGSLTPAPSLRNFFREGNSENNKTSNHFMNKGRTRDKVKSVGPMTARTEVNSGRSYRIHGSNDKEPDFQENWKNDRCRDCVDVKRFGHKQNQTLNEERKLSPETQNRNYLYSVYQGNIRSGTRKLLVFNDIDYDDYDVENYNDEDGRYWHRISKRDVDNKKEVPHTVDEDGKEVTTDENHAQETDSEEKDTGENEIDTNDEKENIENNEQDEYEDEESDDKKETDEENLDAEDKEKDPENSESGSNEEGDDDDTAEKEEEEEDEEEEEKEVNKDDDDKNATEEDKEVDIDDEESLLPGETLEERLKADEEEEKEEVVTDDPNNLPTEPTSTTKCAAKPEGSKWTEPFRKLIEHPTPKTSEDITKHPGFMANLMGGSSSATKVQEVRAVIIITTLVQLLLQVQYSNHCSKLML